MGRRDRLSLRSYLHNILLHLLKWRYQPERHGTSWKLSIRNGRRQARSLIKESPSLKPLLAEIAEDEYPSAREDAADETGLSISIFPETCPFTIEQITGDHWPD